MKKQKQSFSNVSKILLGLTIILTFALVNLIKPFTNDLINNNLTEVFYPLSGTDIHFSQNNFCGSAVSQRFTVQSDMFSGLKIILHNSKKLQPSDLAIHLREKNSRVQTSSKTQHYPLPMKEYSVELYFPSITNSKGKRFELSIIPLNQADSKEHMATAILQIQSIHSYSALRHRFNPQLAMQLVQKKLAQYLSNSSASFFFFLTVLCVGAMLFLRRIKDQLFMFAQKSIQKIWIFIQSVDISDRAIVLIIFSTTLFVNLLFVNLDIDPHHDGILLKPAVDVSRGALLFRDTFSQYGALTTGIQVLFMDLFGEKLLVLKQSAALFYALSYSVLYIIFKRFVPRAILSITMFSWIFISPDISGVFLPWSSVYALFFQLLATYCFVRFQESGKIIFILASGVLASLTLWSRQSVGIVLLLSFLVIEILLTVRSLQSWKVFVKNSFILLVGFGLSFSSFILVFLVNGSLADMMKQSFLFSVLWREDVADKRNELFFLVRCLLNSSDIWTLYPLLTTVVLFLKRNNKVIFSIALIGLSSWLQYYPISDDRHYYWAAALMMPMLGYSIFELFKRMGFKKKITPQTLSLMACFLVVFLQLPILGIRIHMGIKRLTEDRITLSHPKVLEGMRVVPAVARDFEYLINTVQAFKTIAPHGVIITDSRDALYGTLDPRIKNFYKTTVNWDILTKNIYPEYQLLFQEKIQNNDALVISSHQSSPNDNYCRINHLSNPETPPLYFLYAPCGIVKK